MTSAQALFAYCIAVLAPATGVLAGIRCSRDGNRSPLAGLVLGTMAVFCIIVACAILSIFCFPDYPQKRVSEPLAMAFTLPVIFGAIATVWLVVPKTKSKRPTAWFASAALLAIYLTGMYASYWSATWPQRRALPWSATNVQEHVWTDGFLPDFSYHLKARIPESEFEHYVRRLGLERNADERPRFGPDWGQSGEIPWWDPSPDMGITYSQVYSDGGTFAKYENGWLYVYSFDM